MSDPDGTATASPSSRFTPRPADDPTYRVDPGHGWVLFAGIMLAVVGVLNVAYGIAAVSDSKFYARDVAYVIGSLNTWGWFLIVVGVVQLCAAVGIWTASEWGRWLGILFATVNGFVQFFVLPSYPLWALAIFMVDVIIVFGLLTYGGRDRYSLA
jgi:uncharacterized membrane protein (DUF2068 family)